MQDTVNDSQIILNKELFLFIHYVFGDGMEQIRNHTVFSVSIDPVRIHYGKNGFK